MDDNRDAPIYRLTPSPIRRWTGVLVLGALGVLLLYLSAGAPELVAFWRAVLVVLGAAAIWGADRMRRATELSVELTHQGLSDTAGRVLAPIAGIASVDRGTFAFKPSNGFLVRLKEPAPRAWAPGLWWRIGRSVGVGGVTSRDEAKLMADLLTQMLKEREG